MDKYKPVYKVEGNYGHFNLGIEIKIDGDVPEAVMSKIRNHGDQITNDILRELTRNDPAAINYHYQLIKNIRDLFDQVVFIEEIPNEYSNDYYNVHNPWFVVTTGLGRIKIGWRKRVLSLDWSQSMVTKTAEELFPDENVTKDGQLIHAWSYDDAKKYLKVILEQS